ncbi:uncharacterized protein LOC122808179 [Protopterus annectens]|uniref:uncharacterized protein LOC122808179 n=1 Tax=Protopterus annectens TaxID=7888 RepID=UPI001CFC3EB9|nr:uncharacterized protein LOC122808179 [Protopterus annectens]
MLLTFNIDGEHVDHLLLSPVQHQDMLKPPRSSHFVDEGQQKSLQKIVHRGRTLEVAMDVNASCFTSTIHRKLTHSNTLLHYTSCHPFTQKRAVVKAHQLSLSSSSPSSYHDVVYGMFQHGSMVSGTEELEFFGESICEVNTDIALDVSSNVEFHLWMYSVDDDTGDVEQATGLEEDPCYSFVRSNLLSSGVNGAMDNSNGIGLEEPCYLLSGSSLPSSGVNGGMDNSKALETKEDLLKNGRQPTKLLIAFIITVIILLTANIALITWNAHLSNNLHQSIQHLAEKDKQIGELNISCGNLNTELQENKGNFSVLIRNIQSMFKGKELPDLRIPGTQLSNILNQSIQNLAEKDKKYVHLNITYGNLSKEMQEIKGNFSELIRNIQSVCEGKLPDLKLPGKCFQLFINYN